MRFCAFALILLFCQVQAQHWTYFTTIPASGSNQGKFYLWVPPQATSIKGLILASEARLSQIAGDTLIRQSCAEAGLGILGFKGTSFLSGFTSSDSSQLLQALSKLATISKFPEIAHCPWISYGTSVGGIFAWQIANIMPHRVAGVIEDNAIFTREISGLNRQFGIPLLVSRGSNEQVDDRWFESRDSVLSVRKRGGPATLLLQAGCGHFGWTKFESQYIALWLKKIVDNRIPSIAINGPITLSAVDESSGWLTDSSFYSSNIQLNSFSSYSGDKELAFWHFDQELATLWKTLHQSQFARQSQTVITATYPESSCPNALAFQTCDNSVSLGQNENIFNLNASATSGLPVRFGTYNGAFIIENNQVKITSGALETNGTTGWVVSIQEGNENFQCFERSLRFQVRTKNTGTTQTISLTPTPDQNYSSTGIPPQVSVSSGLSPEVFIETGSIKYSNGILNILPFPRGTSTAIVRYGQSGAINHATATSRVDTFLIVRSDSVTYTWKKKKAIECMNIYPNPAEEGIFFKLPEGEKVKKIRILNTIGQVKYVPEIINSNDLYIQFEHLHSGEYILEVETNFTKRVKRFTKLTP